jgi:glycerophosphoryl diester phosphodiesterase
MDMESIQNRPVEIIAHRGASFIAPENTLSAVRLGWEMSADGVEIDIRLSADGRIVLMHDPDTTRTTGQPYTVAETTASTLRTLDAGTMKPEVFSGERIPFLEEVVSCIPDNGTLFIEIKCGSEIIPPLETVIEASGNRSRIAFKSFNIETLSDAAAYFRNIPCYWLIERSTEHDRDDRNDDNRRIIDAAIKRGFRGISVNSAGITREFTEQVTDAGLRLFAWTINEPENAKRFVSYGVNGLVTDRPGWLREALEIRNSKQYNI